MKNSFITLRSVLLILSLSLTSLSAQSQTKIGDLYFTMSGSDANVVPPSSSNVYSGDADGNIFIPSVIKYGGKDYTVTKIENGAFQNSTAKHIYLPSTIKTIGQSLFANSSIEELILGDNIAMDNSYSLAQDCIDLKSAYLPSSIEEIKSSTFQGCTSLESFAFPTEINTIGQNAFDGSSLKNGLFLNDRIQDIQSQAFLGVKLEEFWFPAQIIGGGFYLNILSNRSFYNSSIKKIITGVKFPLETEGSGSSKKTYSFYGINIKQIICAYQPTNSTSTDNLYFGSDNLTVYAPNDDIAKYYKRTDSTIEEVKSNNYNNADKIITDAIILGAIPSQYFGEGSVDINDFNKYDPKTDDDFYITSKSDYEELTYEIDDPSIATINGTIVVFHKAGVVTITASSKDGREIANPVRKLCIMPNTVTVKLVNENGGDEGTSPKAKFEYSCGWADSNNKGWSTDYIESLLTVSPGIKNIQIGSGEDEIGSVPYGAQSDCFVFIYDSSTTKFEEINPGVIPGTGGGTVEPAKTNVTVTIENATIQYKDEIPSPTYTLPADFTEGSEEIKAALEGKLEWNVTGTASPGTYHFKAVEETITSDNYNITVNGINAKLTIEKLLVTVTVVSKIINDTDEVPTPEVTYSVELSEPEQTEITTGYGEKLQWEVPLNGVKLTAGTYKIAEIEPFETTHFGIKTDISNATLTVTKTTERITIPENLPDVLQGLKYGRESIELNLKSNDGIADDVPVEYYIDQANPEGCISINEDGTLLSISRAGKALLQVRSNSDDYEIEDEGRTITVDKYDVEVVVNGVEITDDVQQVPDVTFSYNDLPFETDKEAIETALKNILKWNYEKGENRVIKDGEYGLAEYTKPVMDNYNITINADNAKLKVNRAIDRLILKLESERKSFNVSFSVNAVTKFKYNEEKVPDIGKKINIVGYDTNASFYVDYPENINQIVIEDDYTNSVELYGNLTNLEVLDVTKAKNLKVENIKLPEILSSEIIQTSDETGSKVKKDDENGDDNEGKEVDNNKEGENDDDENTGL
ncbi:MAG: leucine-rich repeat protein [Muribaculaceae bacterium]|nr:leucine-rich repeat protein [Muribaculaceae bacterium]